MVKRNLSVKYIVCEGSLLTTLQVYERMLYQKGYIREIEHQVYESLFFDKSLEWMMPKKILYLNQDCNDSFSDLSLVRDLKDQQDGLRRIITTCKEDLQDVKDRYNSLPEIQNATHLEGSLSDRKQTEVWVAETISQMPRL